jgi:hypothetical protein
MILIVTALALGIHHAGAQYVTYNHDETKMNQVTVMETGAGSLTPALFYSLIHNKYYRTASATNKLSYRSTAGGFAYSQVGLAEKVDTSLTKRAEIEALNMADRQVDLAWQAEGPKIQSRLEAFNRNIARLTEAGGNGGDLALWRERYHLFQTAVSAIRDSYMPNAERKKEYLAIYRDITEHNNTLIAYIISVDSRERTKDHLEATLERPDRNGEIAAEARGRWKETSNRTNP